MRTPGCWGQRPVTGRSVASAIASCSPKFEKHFSNFALHRGGKDRRRKGARVGGRWRSAFYGATGPTRKGAQLKFRWAKDLRVRGALRQRPTGDGSPDRLERPGDKCAKGSGTTAAACQAESRKTWRDFDADRKGELRHALVAPRQSRALSCPRQVPCPMPKVRCALRGRERPCTAWDKT